MYEHMCMCICMCMYMHAYVCIYGYIYGNYHKTTSYIECTNFSCHNEGLYHICSLFKFYIVVLNYYFPSPSSFGWDHTPMQNWTWFQRGENAQKVNGMESSHGFQATASVQIFKQELGEKEKPKVLFTLCKKMTICKSIPGNGELIVKV